MSTQLRHRLHRVDQTHISFWLIYLLASVFMFHSLLVAYSSSTFMEQFLTPTGVSTLYTISSSISVIAFLFISQVLRTLGNVRLTLYLAVLDLIALLILGTTHHAATAIVAFVVFMSISPLLYLNIDIFSETLIGDNELTTGSKRGLVLGLTSLAAALAPFTLIIIVGSNDTHLNRTYLIAAALFSIFILIIITRFNRFNDPVYQEAKIVGTIQQFWKQKDVRNVFLAEFLLQIFFTWTVIYMPLYMATVIGFSWSSIGAIIGVGVTAYVIFEYPVGLIADKYIGEKEMMASGFLILAVTSSWIAFMAGASMFAWMLLMFINRIGASLVEATCESYFFKHTRGSDANIMSFFRLTHPLSIVVGSLMGSTALLFLPFNLIFIVLGFAMIPGLFFAMVLKDTK